MTNEERETRFDEAEKECAELRRIKADHDKRYFKLFRELVTVCLDERGNVQWDFIEQALIPSGEITMTAYPPDSWPKQA